MPTIAPSTDLPRVIYPTRHYHRCQLIDPHTIEQPPTIEDVFIRLDRMINGDATMNGWGKSTSKWQLVQTDYYTPDLTPSGKPFYTCHLSHGYNGEADYRSGPRTLRTKRVFGWHLVEEGRHGSVIRIPNAIGEALAHEWKQSGTYVKEFTRKGPAAILKILVNWLSREDLERGQAAVKAEHERKAQLVKQQARSRIAEQAKQLTEVLVKNAGTAGIDVPAQFAFWLAGLSEQV